MASDPTPGNADTSVLGGLAGRVRRNRWTGLFVNAPHDSQRLTVDEAIAAYIRGTASAEFADGEKGTLEPGMLGDAVVLDRDPFEHPETIDEIRVEYSVVDGRVAFSRPP